jgi:agmatinase
MSFTPTFATPPGFLGLPTRQAAGARFVIAGIPLDIGTTNRAGARFGPQAIRHASRMLVDGAHPVRWLDPLTLDIVDAGDFAIALGDLPKSVMLIEQQATAINGHLIALGGEHGVTLPLLRTLRRRLGAPVGLLHADAHVDTWPDSFGQTLGHGSVFFHAIEEGLIDPARTVQVGIRSPVQRSVMEWTLARGVKVISAQDVHAAGPDAIAARVRGIVGDSTPSYLSLDIDVLDPAFAPGTGTPEIGGLASWQAQALLRGLGGIKFAGMDLVEVLPAHDVSEITALAAATFVWEYLALVA